MNTTVASKPGKIERLKNLVRKWMGKKEASRLLPPADKIPGK